ncbi:MAG: hypothetical protein NVS9B14_17020 [Candidatus Acidiferrum sp.]
MTVIELQESESDARKKLQQLRAKRNHLYEQFLKHPWNIKLAIEIKTIDDQVAEFVKSATAKRRSGA